MNSTRRSARVPTQISTASQPAAKFPACPSAYTFSLLFILIIKQKITGKRMARRAKLKFMSTPKFLEIADDLNFKLHYAN